MSSRRKNKSVQDAVVRQLQELFQTFESLMDENAFTKQTEAMKQKITSQRKKLVDLMEKRQKMVSSKLRKKSLLLRVNMQKSVRRAITGDPNRSIRRHIQSPPQIKLIDKASFTMSLINLILAEFFLLCHPSYFGYYYAAMLIILMIGRYFDYKEKKWGYFMLDFCYFANFIAILHIFFFPDSTWLFDVLFVLANGPILLAIMVWRNSMVLHSVDKMTSLFIHVFPPFYTYCHKYLDISRVRIQSTQLSLSAWLFWPTILYCCWQFAYLFKTEVVSAAYLESNTDVETSLRWISRDYNNAMNKLAMTLCSKVGIMRRGEKFDSTSWKTKFIFVAMNFLYYSVSIVPACFLYDHQYWHLASMLIAVAVTMWQGANYYIEVFSARYRDSLEAKEKELEEKYLFIDENLDRLLEKNWREISSDVSDIDDDSSDEPSVSKTNQQIKKNH